jgi:hypothetical protein
MRLPRRRMSRVGGHGAGLSGATVRSGPLWLMAPNRACAFEGGAGEAVNPAISTAATSRLVDERQVAVISVGPVGALAPKGRDRSKAWPVRMACFMGSGDLRSLSPLRKLCHDC